VQSLARRLEEGRGLSYAGVSGAAHPFLAALLRRPFPSTPIIVVTDRLKAQETFHQDLTTWLEVSDRNSPASYSSPLFYPAWEVLPHESRLPHVDVISERLETLIALIKAKTPSPKSKVETGAVESEIKNEESRTTTAPIAVTTVAALLQRTFPRDLLQRRSRPVVRADRIDPLDLVEWLEDQGYEPEAQVTQKGEIALRGGILDIYPPTSPWPVRLEFFGDELESLRYFDPLTQISKEETSGLTISPAGELGILKKLSNERKDRGVSNSDLEFGATAFGTLLDYLPAGSLFILCEPDALDERAAEYAAQIPERDPFCISWAEFQTQAAAREMIIIGLSEANPADVALEPDTNIPHSSGCFPHFEGLDAFRPLTDRPPEPQVAETQRREFFSQLHRWTRQSYAVHVFCNNDGEWQRFNEIWAEYGFHEVQSPRSNAQERTKLEDQQLEGHEPNSNGGTKRMAPESRPWTLDFGLWTHVGSLSRGFFYQDAKLVVVTDAEIFGRYKLQRPRRLKSPHAQATRSALDIDFTDLEEGDYVVHVQHGIGRYLGLQVLPIGAGTKPTEKAVDASASGQECLVIEYAPMDSAQPAP